MSGSRFRDIRSYSSRTAAVKEAVANRAREAAEGLSASAMEIAPTQPDSQPLEALVSLPEDEIQGKIEEGGESVDSEDEDSSSEDSKDEGAVEEE